jgi:hypothetical protein
MATQGAIQTFSESPTSRGGNAIPAAFLAAGEAKYDEGSGGYSPAGERKLRDVLTYAEYLDSKDRQAWEQKHRAAQDQHQIEMDKRQQRRLDIELERQKRQDEIALHNEELEHRAGSLGADLYRLDPNRPDYPQKRDELLADAKNHEALNSKFGKEVMENLKYQDARHNNMREWFNAKSQESGYQGDFYDPSHRDKEGNLDYGKLNNLFQQASQQKAVDLESAQREEEYKMGQQGMVLKRSSFDPRTGQMTKQEYVPVKETGIREITQQGKALDNRFKRYFGNITNDILNYDIGYKDPKGYTLTQGREEKGKFIPDPAGDVVKIHSAIHKQADKVVSIDAFNKFKEDYANQSAREQDIQSQFPGIKKATEGGQQAAPQGEKPAAAPQPETATGRLQQKRATEESAKQQQRTITAAEQEISALQSRIQEKKKRLESGLIGEDETEQSLKDQIEEDEATLEDGKNALSQYKSKTSPLSEQSKGDTGIDWSKYNR